LSRVLGRSKKRTTEEQLKGLEALAKEHEKRLDVIEKVQIDRLDLPVQIYHLKEQAEKLEKKVNDLKDTLDADLQSIREALRNKGITASNSQTALAILQSDVKNINEQLKEEEKKRQEFETRLKNVETAIQTPTGKTSPATASRKTTDVFEDKDFSPKVKKLIRNALDTLSSSDDQR